MMRTVLTLGLILGAAGDGLGAVVYVDDDAPAGGDGTSWPTAFRYLRDALAATVPGGEIRVAGGIYRPDRDEAGQVTPGDRNASFALKPGLQVLGGFAGLADPQQPDRREPGTFVSILSGDLAGNDQPNFGNYADNARHVLTATGTDPAAVLDGLTVTGGNGDFVPEQLLGGGGVFVLDGRLEIRDCLFRANSVGLNMPTVGNFGGAIYLKSSGALTIARSRFEGNRATSGGALGVFVEAGGTVNVTECTFRENYTDDQLGGAVYGAYGQYVYERCIFAQNHAQYAGGVFAVLARSMEFRDCDFERNLALVQGGAVWLDRCDSNDLEPARFAGCRFLLNTGDAAGGALRLDETIVHMANTAFLGNVSNDGGGGAVFIEFEEGHEFTNCLFSGNSAPFCGGLEFSRASVAVSNCTFAGNLGTANFDGAGILADRSLLDLQNSVLFGNRTGLGGGEPAQLFLSFSTATVDYTLIEGWTDNLGGTGNLGGDPRFVDADGPDNTPGTADDNLRLLTPGSPCIDAADNTGVPPDILDLDGDGNTTEPTPIDLDGRRRFVDDPATADTGVGPPPVVDMGAYEGQPVTPGDLNCDGVVDFFDINPFVQALSDPAGWQASYPSCPAANGDVNGDGRVDFEDINPFVALLTGA